ncbi:MAG: hypothetical protein LBH96_06450 [Candidatus Peribacteria bacterium]|jgi:hypothetical protein|nr:hypothetical protein [Candidatus Peribacteria bacterium]
MELYIIANQDLFTQEQLQQLKQQYEVSFVEDGNHLLTANFTHSQKEKILAIDPDFCNWNFPNTILENTSNIKALCL